MEHFSQWLISVKIEESHSIIQMAKNFFLTKIPLSFSVQLLEENDIDDIIALQQGFKEEGALRQNSKEQLRESLEKGVWLGIFNEDDQLEAYTVFEFELIDNNILLYLKATVKLKREGRLKNFQKQTLELRKKLGGDLAAKSMISFGGGYASCHPKNTRCVDNLTCSGMYRLFHIKALYGESPEGDRDIFGYGDIFDLKELLFDKWDAFDISE